MVQVQYTGNATRYIVGTPEKSHEFNADNGFVVEMTEAEYATMKSDTTLTKVDVTEDKLTKVKE